jgi:serine protease
VSDSSWHGTHVSGTIAAATGNGVGAAGVAPDAKVMPVRVLGVGGGTTDDIAQGILYAAGLENDSGALPAKKADVINMSLGGRGLSQQMAGAIADARAAGTIVVVSAGNDDSNAASYSPAGEEGVITVGAVDYSNQRASYSNFGSVVEVVAPGGDESRDANNDGMPDGVMSLVNAKGGKTLYTTYEGTSMAAPHVSGIIALMKSVYPGLTPDILDTMIRATGASAIVQDLGTPGKDVDFGYGLLNANLAVIASLERGQAPAPETPVLQVSTNTLDFGSTETQLTVEIRNVGRGTLTLGTVAASAGFTVTPGAGAIGTNTVKLNRASLPDGIHTGTLTIASNGGNATINLRANIGAAAVLGGDVGPVYVLLVDPATSQGLFQAVATAADGYAFTLPNVPPAQYILVAGTDIDDNIIINDEGEAFGAFPTTSSPEEIDLTSARDDLDFPVRFQFNVAAAKTGMAPGGQKFRRLR